jgi:hypothetical protein
MQTAMQHWSYRIDQMSQKVTAGKSKAAKSSKGDPLALKKRLKAPDVCSPDLDDQRGALCGPFFYQYSFSQAHSIAEGRGRLNKRSSSVLTNLFQCTVYAPIDARYNRVASAFDSCLNSAGDIEGGTQTGKETDNATRGR